MRREVIDTIRKNKDEQACVQAMESGLYHFHPGAPPDAAYASDFPTGMAYECFVKAVMTWHGFPANATEFAPRSRAELKRDAPYLATVVARFFDDGDWNQCEGVRIDAPRDQTWNLTCASAPGSAWCGEPLSPEYMGPKLSEQTLVV